MFSNINTMSKEEISIIVTHPLYALAIFTIVGVLALSAGIILNALDEGN